jgi:hypothetical protein
MITGVNEKGNEYTYWKATEPTEKGKEYFDGFNEQYTSLRCFQNLIVPIVQYVRFGEYEITGDVWRFIGSPVQLTAQQIIDLQTIENLTINDLELFDTAMHLCNTDPAHILNAELDGTESSPFIWGGEVYYPESNGGDDNMPF